MLSVYEKRPCAATETKPDCWSSSTPLTAAFTRAAPSQAFVFVFEVSEPKERNFLLALKDARKFTLTGGRLWLLPLFLTALDVWETSADVIANASVDLELGADAWERSGRICQHLCGQCAWQRHWTIFVISSSYRSVSDRIEDSEKTLLLKLQLCAQTFRGHFKQPVRHNPKHRYGDVYTATVSNL